MKDKPENRTTGEGIQNTAASTRQLPVMGSRLPGVSLITLPQLDHAVLQETTAKLTQATRESKQIDRSAILLVSAIEAIRTKESVDGKPYVISLSGEPGVGKTTLADAITELYLRHGIRCKRLSADAYYRQPIPEGLTNMRESTKCLSVGPTEWDLDDLQRDLYSFQEGNTILFREVDWETYDVSKQPLEPGSIDILIIDHLMADLLTVDLAVRLTADPKRITEQAERFDRPERTAAQDTPLLRSVRERERLIVAEIWKTMSYPHQLVLCDYETVLDESDLNAPEQSLTEKLGILSNLVYIGTAPRQRILDKLVLLEKSLKSHSSYAELIWIEAALRLLPRDIADSYRKRLTADVAYPKIINSIYQDLLSMEK